MRADQLLVARGLARSRARARALIERGLVLLDGAVLEKPSTQLAETASITLREPDFPWVSRAALKLLYALDHFGIDGADKVCLDLGASTGGFTQVLLECGAARVFAVDVGRDQLASEVAGDQRVACLDGVNARDLTADLVNPPPELIVCDVSFIGLRLVLPPALALAAPSAALVALIKPQFEVGRASIGKGGVVRDAAAQQRVCAEIQAWLRDQPGWSPADPIESPITGADGNREFLIAAWRGAGRP